MKPSILMLPLFGLLLLQACTSTPSPPPNLVPVVISDSYRLYSTDSKLSVDANGGVLANDADPEAKVLSVQLTTPPQYNQGEFVLQSDGSFEYAYDGSGVTEDSFEYLASDGVQDSEPARVSLVIEPNTVPEAEADTVYFYADQNTLEVAAESGVLANDEDAEQDILTATLATPPANHDGEFVLQSDGGFEYKPLDKALIRDSFSYTPHDGKAAGETVTVTLLVNAPPVGKADNFFIDAITGGTENVGGNDTDADNEALTFALETAPKNHDGEFSLNADTGEFSYTAKIKTLVEDSFSYTVSDGKVVSDPVQVTITTNHLPVATGQCEERTPADGSITVELSELVSDGDAVDTLVYLIKEGPEELIELDANTGHVSFSPEAGMKNSRGDKYSFTFEVTDPKGATASADYEFIYGTPRIMPVGDSLTYGVTGNLNGVDSPENADAVGYRKKLYELLDEAGYSFSFVGSHSSGWNTGLPETAHQGHPGDSTSVVLGHISDSLDANVTDVMLLLIGTNDNIFEPVTRATAVANVDEIIRTATEWAEGNDDPESTVIGHHQDIEIVVGKVIPHHESKKPVDAMMYNTDLQTMIEANWDQIKIADLYTAIDPVTDMSTLDEDEFGLHPNMDGYEKMAQVWFNSLIATGALNKCETDTE